MPDTTLLATDQQRSVLSTLKANQPPQAITYSPYGHRPADCRLLSVSGFNGELTDPMTGHYLLGNGYRALNPVLMRFHSPDSLSPFKKGGLNPYAYCGNDPINFHDRNGHFPTLSYLPHKLRASALKRIDFPGDLKALNSTPIPSKQSTHRGPSTTTHTPYTDFPGQWKETTTLNNEGNRTPVRTVYGTPDVTQIYTNSGTPYTLYPTRNLKELSFSKIQGRKLYDTYNKYALLPTNPNIDLQNLSTATHNYMRQNNMDATNILIAQFQVDRWAMKGKLNGVRPSAVADSIRERWSRVYK